MIILKQKGQIYVVNNLGRGITMKDCVKLALQVEMERRELCNLDDVPEDEPGAVPDSLLKAVGARQRHNTSLEGGWNALWKVLLPQLALDRRVVDSPSGEATWTQNKRGSAGWCRRIEELQQEMYNMAGGSAEACEFVDELLRVYLNWDA
jgi:hypothetical protein